MEDLKLTLDEIIINYYGQKVSAKYLQDTPIPSAEFSQKLFNRHVFENNYVATICYSKIVSGKTIKVTIDYDFQVSFLNIAHKQSKIFQSFRSYKLKICGA